MIATIYTIEIRCYEEKYRYGYTEKELVDCTFLIGDNKEELIEEAKQLMENKENWFADDPFFNIRVKRQVLSNLKYEENNNEDDNILGNLYRPKYSSWYKENKKPYKF